MSPSVGTREVVEPASYEKARLHPAIHLEHGDRSLFGTFHMFRDKTPTVYALVASKEQSCTG